MSGAAPGFDPRINPNEVAARVGLLRVVQQGAQWVRAEQDRLAHASMLPSGRVAAVVAGRVLGRLNMPRDPVHVEVTDEGALFDWVKAKRPDQVEEFTARRVYPAYIAWLLQQARKHGVAVDEQSGEVIPGITVDTSPPAPTMTLEDDAPQQVADAMADPASRPFVVAALEELLAGMLGMPGVTVTVNVPDSGPGPVPDHWDHCHSDGQGDGAPTAAPGGGPVTRACGPCGMDTAHAVIGPGRLQCLVCQTVTGDDEAAAP